MPQGRHAEQIGDLSGLSNTNPVMATILTILMFAGRIPPPRRGSVRLPARQCRTYALAVIGVLASVVGAYYYLRIIKIKVS